MHCCAYIDSRQWNELNSLEIIVSYNNSAIVLHKYAPEKSRRSQFARTRAKDLHRARIIPFPPPYFSPPPPFALSLCSCSFFKRDATQRVGEIPRAGYRLIGRTDARVMPRKQPITIDK